MSSLARGADTSLAEVTHISRLGLWVLVEEREFFLPFEDFPWFREATIDQIQTVEYPHPQHLYWPKLDVDLDLDSIKHPESYPLLARQG